MSVIVPIYNQASFLLRALRSVFAQSYPIWEILIVNDGSTDGVEKNLEWIEDERITYLVNQKNEGLGFCLNAALIKAKYEFIAYLPADDVYFENHLETLMRELTDNQDAILAYSQFRRDEYDFTANSNHIGISQVPNLQLVQVLHRNLGVKWMDRARITTDDLALMYWLKLSAFGRILALPKFTCEWVAHPTQRHRLISENEHWGGIAKYKLHYNVECRLRFKSIGGNLIDELDMASAPQAATDCKTQLTILIVGDLGYNPERLIALERRGCKLFGLWIQNPYHFNAIGPFPFSSIQTVKFENWKSEIEQIRPDIIYGLLNSQSVELAHEVMMAFLNIPFVWHFKESPFVCRRQGTWNKLINLYELADGQIYINTLMKEWFEQYLKQKSGNFMILDGDLPSTNFFTGQYSSRKSLSDGAVHTVVAGRPYGIKSEDIGILAQHNIHVHLYGDIHVAGRIDWIKKVLRAAPKHFHVHNNCDSSNWRKEFSQYDAAWLHIFDSHNYGELARVDWNDLNYPARLSTYASAGTPMIFRDNSKHLVASQSLADNLAIGVKYTTIDELAYKLNSRRGTDLARNELHRNSNDFCFDNHVDELIEFFRTIVNISK